MIRWFRRFAATSAADDPAGSGRGFGSERNPERVVFFSDAVFAIAVTLLVLEIRPPQDTWHLLHGLAALWPSYLAYAMTFLSSGRCGPTITSCSTTSAAPTGWCCSSTPCC
jgi:hypothetical protein